MSHFTKCELKMTNLAALKKALEDLGYGYTEAQAHQKAQVRGWRGQKTEAELSIDMGKYDIGVVASENGTYDLTADWWGVETTKAITEQEFKDTLYQKYQYHNVLQACEDKGYTVEEELNEEDGTIQLVVRKWVAS